MLHIAEYCTLFFSLIGFLISLYFTLVYYKMITPSSPIIPSFCRMDEQSCVTIIHSPPAHLLKIAPNFVLALFYYTALITGTILNHIRATTLNELMIVMIVISWLVVGASLHLTHQLIFVMKTHCPLCFTSHIVNLGIAVALSVGY